MKQLPDDHFRRRLKDHSLPPPPSAWSRIESNLPGTRRNTWIKIAAAILLLLTASALIVLMRDNNSKPQMVAEEQSLPKENPPHQTDSTVGSEGANESNRIPTEETLAAEETLQTRPDPPSARSTVTKDELLPDRTETRVAETTATDSHDVVTAEPAPDANATTSAVATKVPASAPAPFKLVLEADEVQAKYLRKKSVAHATDEDTKSSGLKKLLNKANDISNQDPIGDLRQMKDDIFALNFQGKKRDQRK